MTFVQMINFSNPSKSLENGLLLPSQRPGNLGALRTLRCTLPSHCLVADLIAPKSAIPPCPASPGATSRGQFPMSYCFVFKLADSIRQKYP